MAGERPMLIRGAGPAAQFGFQHRPFMGLEVFLQTAALASLTMAAEVVVDELPSITIRIRSMALWPRTAGPEPCMAARGQFTKAQGAKPLSFWWTMPAGAEPT